MWSKIFDRVSFLSLFLVIVLLPVFFLPFTKITVETSKGLLLVVGLTISIIFWALARFSDGKIVVSRSWLLLSGVLVVLAILVSAIFSGARQMSFFGNMFDIGSFWFIFVAFLLMLTSSVILGNRGKARVVLLGVIASSTIVLLFQILRFYFPTHLAFGILGGKLGNTLGSWNALGVFAGFSALMSLFIMEFFPVSKAGKWVLGILMVLSALLVAAVSFSFVWEILGISALIIFIYKVSYFSSTNADADAAEGGPHKIHFPIAAFALVMISLLFFIAGQSVGQYLPNRLGLSNSEISPSFMATMSTTKAVLKASPVFGLGPNMFESAWAMYKPTSINNTLFWNAPFSVGFGLFPTFTATTGLLGILSWLLFFVIFLWTGIKSLFSNIKTGSNSEMAIFFIATLYLFISSFFYFTGTVIFLLSMAFTGIFIGLHSSAKENGTMTFGFLNDHRKTFFFILSFMLLIIISAALAFKYIERFSSIFYFQKTLDAQAVVDAENASQRALSLYPNDLYLRTYAEVKVIKLNNLVAKGTALTDADKTDLQNTFNQAVASAVLASSFNPKNYLNFQTLGSVYSAVAVIGVKDSYDKAIQAYTTAQKLSPLNPTSDFAMAQLSFAVGKTSDAKTYANAALAIKPDYVDALLLLSQISKNAGDSAGALSYAQQALAADPTNQSLIKYVNSLKGSSSSSTSSSTSTKTTTGQ